VESSTKSDPMSRNSYSFSEPETTLPGALAEPTAPPVQSMAIASAANPSGAAKRGFDWALVLVLLPVLMPIMLVIALAVKLTSRGPVLYWSDRIGVNNTVFKMPKFRTMKVGTPAVATHLMNAPQRYVTILGKFLRKTSLDELPQLLSIIQGDLSFVGPRPALFNQDDLVALRTERGIHRLVPGLTGWAQVNGRDELSIRDKVEYDFHYLQNCSFVFDLKILFQTFLKICRGEGVKH